MILGVGVGRVGGDDVADPAEVHLADPDTGLMITRDPRVCCRCRVGPRRKMKLPACSKWITHWLIPIEKIIAPRALLFGRILLSDLCLLFLAFDRLA